MLAGHPHTPHISTHLEKSQKLVKNDERWCKMLALIPISYVHIFFQLLHP